MVHSFIDDLLQKRIIVPVYSYSEYRLFMEIEGHEGEYYRKIIIPSSSYAVVFI